MLQTHRRFESNLIFSSPINVSKKSPIVATAEILSPNLFDVTGFQLTLLLYEYTASIVTCSHFQYKLSKLLVAVRNNAEDRATKTIFLRMNVTTVSIATPNELTGNDWLESIVLSVLGVVGGRT